MNKRKKKRLCRLSIMITGFLIMFCVVFFGVQFITKTGVFLVPGTIKIDSSLSDDEKAVIEQIFNDEITLRADVNITARSELVLPELGEGEFLYEIYVPVTNFYDFSDNILANSAEELMEDYNMIPVNSLSFRQRLMKVNGQYYLDEFNKGAVFRIIKFESDKYKEEIAPLVSEVMAKRFPSSNDTLTLAQTGVTALSRGMNSKLKQVGDAGYFAQEVGDFLSSFDLTHTSNESSFTNYASSSNICSDKRFINTLTAIGLDIVELTGNHNQDCGDDAAIETIDMYAENNIKMVGGGKTADEAAIPLDIDEKGNNITMLAYNLSTGGATYDNTPGANQYYEEVAAKQIAEAKANGDFVIVDIQYYECSSYDTSYENTACDYANSAAGDQIGFFRHLIDLGADVVVGTSAHQPQTFELYGDGAIYYGLGNLFFDQVWWPGTTRSLVLVHHFHNGQLLQTEIVPTVYDSSMQTRLMDDEDAEWFLNRLENARPEAVDDDNTAQVKINQWAKSVGGEKGVIFYDLKKNEVLAEYNANEQFGTASLYKLFVVYEGYRRVQSGEWDKNTVVGSTGYNIGECLDLAIRESYSPCAETMWEMIGRDDLDKIVQNDFGIDLEVGEFSATPRQIMKMLKIFYKHKEVVDDELISLMKDSFLNQPVTTYDWRQGLPSGFSDAVSVYDKVGWDRNGYSWNIYNDAAILSVPATNKHYILVVMTSGVDHQQIRNLGTIIEKIIIN